MPHIHRESHRSDRIGWLRAAVLGANDGTISVASLVVGVAGSSAPQSSVLLTGVTDYGITLEAILSGKERVPPQGVRMDVTFVGRLAGRVRGIDYLRMRADGRIDLHILAVVETENGCRIALSADGVGVPRVAEPIADLLFNVSLTTAAESYAWVNTRQVWGVGTVNFAVGKIHVDGYMQ